MSNRILYLENVASINAVNFYRTAAMAAEECGLEFHLAYNAMDRSKEKIEALRKEMRVHFHQIDFVRNPFHPGNIKAYSQVCDLIQKIEVDYIHCNTPIGGVIGRLAGKKGRVKRIVYQAHGFHFYKGAPAKNWMLYYPVERWLAHYTDVLITINNEDYERAKRFKLKNHGKVYYVPGVGIDTSQYHSDKQIRIEKRKELGLGDNEIALISMGDLIERKNYPVAIEAVAKVGNQHLHYYICGQGPEEVKLISLAEKLGVKEQIHFLGYRTDIKDLLQAADIFLFTTLQEGLPRSMMEAMASGLPCIASKIRGTVDLLEDCKGGYLVPVDDAGVITEKLRKLASDTELRKKMSERNLIRIKDFDTARVKEIIGKIYREELG